MPINPVCINCGTIDGVNYIVGVAICRRCMAPTPNSAVEEIRSYGQNRTPAQTDGHENT